jgi:DNA-directed RNA polymerase specialized sigma24 family protein
VHAKSEIITANDLKNLMGELRMMARSLLLTERDAQTLTPTALAMSALRRAKVADVDWDDMRWENRRHFFGVINITMKHSLIDHARRARAKGRDQVAYLAWDDKVLQNLAVEAAERPAYVIILDEALAILRASDAASADVLEQFYYAGFTVPEIARFSDVSEKTVDRELKKARILVKKIINRLLGDR